MLPQLSAETEIHNDGTKDNGTPNEVEVVAIESIAVETTSTAAEIPIESTLKEEPSHEFKDWAIHNGPKLMDEIASIPGAEKEDLTIEIVKGIVTSLTPPVNPWLDKPKPTMIEEYLTIESIAVETTSTATEIPIESTLKEEPGQEFKDWAIHNGSKLMDEIASISGAEKEDLTIEIVKEVATSLTPPPPPLDTVKGYNSWLDKPRPTTIEEYLAIESIAVETTSTTAEIPIESTLKEKAGQEFKDWAIHNGSKLMDEIARISGAEKEDLTIEIVKEVATSLTPPPPPLNTVKGYNPWLDKPRPTTIEEYLRNFEVVFVVDDSKSMKGKRWTETRDALATIARKTFELKVDTVSLRFLNNATHVRGLRGKKKLMSLFDNVKPKGNTPLGKALKAVFNEHLDRIDAAVKKGEKDYSKILPLDIIVLTDGKPTDTGKDEPRNVVANAVRRLNERHYHPNTMGVQIVQIAFEEKAKGVLKELVVGDNGRIVDTVPFEGVVDSTKLLRILLGGIHPNIRSQLPVVMLAFEQQHK